MQRHASGVRRILEPNASRSADSQLTCKGGAYTLSLPADVLDVEVVEGALAGPSKRGLLEGSARRLKLSGQRWHCGEGHSARASAVHSLTPSGIGLLSSGSERWQTGLIWTSNSDPRLTSSGSSDDWLQSISPRSECMVYSCGLCTVREGQLTRSPRTHRLAATFARTSAWNPRMHSGRFSDGYSTPIPLWWHPSPHHRPSRFAFGPVSPNRSPLLAPGRAHTGYGMCRATSHFTGRQELLAELGRRLQGGHATQVVQALHGMGGVGKSQLALEYAHRCAADYDLVWWIDAEQPVLIPGQLATLAAQLGVAAGPTVADTVDRLLAELRGRDRWLLIFDNAERPADIAGFRPGGLGNVLITSRNPAWGALGGRLEVDVLTRDETIALLRARIPTLDEDLAGELAAELGDLPLAAAQAAAYLEQTDLPPEEYLRRFRSRRETLLARGDVLGYRGRIDTTWALSIDRLRAENSAAVQLLEIAAFLAPEPIPLALLKSHPELLSEPLRDLAADPDALDDTVGALVGYSLVRRHRHDFQVHRLVQAVIRNQLPPDQQQATSDQVLALLTAGSPGDPEDPRSWDGYTQLTSHVLATAPLGDDSPAGRRLLLDTARYLHARGDSSSSRAVSEPLLERWRSALGLDHPDTLSAASILTLALNELGEAEPARALAEDAFERCRRVLGPDHPNTLWAAAALTAALVGLGQAEPTRALGEGTLERCRRVLGPDHATTLWTAVNLSVAHVLSGHAELARALGEDTLALCRRVLGPDQPTTLWAAAVQTLALAELGQAEPSRALGEDTLERSGRVLGHDHTTTLTAAAALSRGLNQLGEAEAAHTLRQDTLERSRRMLGADNPLARYLTPSLALAPSPDDAAAERLRSLSASPKT